MIIFGSRARHITIGEGQFYCPQCNTKRDYLHKKAKRYFTLYFIPLIPLDELGEYVECQTCKVTFKPEVLTLKAARPAPPDLATLLKETENLLKRGSPIEFMIQSLTSAGLDRDLALQAVEKHLSEGRKTCTDCHLTYHTAAESCYSCQKSLS